MFKMGEVPSPRAAAVEHADYLELECLRKGDKEASGADLAAALGRLDDDVLDEKAIADIRMEATVESAFAELLERYEHSGSGEYKYPFSVTEDASLLKFVGHRGECELYLFMLLATRMNMRTEKIQAGIDGTELFERVCCEVAKSYWGQRTEGLVFGTARRRGSDDVGAFPDAVNVLCGRSGEGIAFYSHSGAAPTAQDGNLDIVVWKGFAERRQGQLIGFGQCKTGTHWSQGAFELIPEGFYRKWVRTAPAVNPVRLFLLRPGRRADNGMTLALMPASYLIAAASLIMPPECHRSRGTGKTGQEPH